MASILETITQVEAQALDILKQTQDTVIETTQKVVDRVAPRIPTVALPGDPAKVVDNAFDFASKVQQANRSFAERLVTVTKPLFEEQKTGPKPAAKTSTKAA